MFSACGGRIGPTPVPAPSINLEGFATAREALAVALGQVAGAGSVARISVSFPRAKGTAEFWTVDLLDPAASDRIRRVEVEGKRAVGVAPLGIVEAGFPQGFRGVPVEQIQVDSSEAVDAVRQLSWVARTDEITLASDALGLGGQDAPEPARGRPFWNLLVRQGESFVGTVWILTLDGSVVFECRTPSC